MGFILIMLTLLFGNLLWTQKRRDEHEALKRKLREKDKQQH